MDRAKIQLFPFEIGDGPANMAADEALLEIATTHRVAALRFYGWAPATLSLGYFQPAADRLQEPSSAALPWVRRATGGSALVHDRELTYALALPPGPPWQTGDAWIPKMHRIIASALNQVVGRPAVTLVTDPCIQGAVLCFQKQTAGDLVCNGAKVVGSAQRKQRQCLLQHGGVLLATSVHAPQLPGLSELTGAAIVRDDVRTAIIAAFGEAIGCKMLPSRWSREGQSLRRRLVRDKYGAAAWNERR